MQSAKDYQPSAAREGENTHNGSIHAIHYDKQRLGKKKGYNYIDHIACQKSVSYQNTKGNVHKRFRMNV